MGVLFHSLFNLRSEIRSTSFKHFSIITISGLLFTCFITTVFCLFFRLGLASHILLLIIAVAGAIFFKENVGFIIRENIKLLKQTPWYFVVLSIAYLLILAHISSLASSHNDDGLYYSTSIKWLQEYGTVKGLANVNPRIAFNSNWLVLQAHYGFDFLKIGLFNDLNGLLFFLVFIYSAGGMLQVIKGNVTVAALLRCFIIVPALFFHHAASSDFMLFNVNFISSPSADIPATLLIWFIFMLYEEYSQKQRNGVLNGEITGVFLLYTVMLVTIKLIAAPVLLVLIYFIVFYLKKQKYSIVLLMFAAATIFVLPWMVRNVLLSGYLVFPFSAVDIFNVDWKLPIENVYWFEKAIKSFAITGTPESGEGLTLIKWFPAWFNHLNVTNSLLFFLVVFSTFTYLIIAVLRFKKKGFSFFSSNSASIVTICICFVGILLWFFKGPDFRFGYGFIMLYCSFVIIWGLKFFLQELVIYTSWAAIFAVAVAVFITHRNDLIEGIFGFEKKAIQPRMPEEVRMIPLSANKSIYIVKGGGIWNAPLPAATEEEYIYIKPALRGKNIKDGFYALNKEHK
jgi:low affinity Fe/Cu permease